MIVLSMASERKKRKDTFLSDIDKTETALNRCVSINWHEMDKWSEDWYINYTFRKTHKLLLELKTSISEYNRWLEESKKILDCETTLISQRERVKELDRKFIRFKKGNLDDAVTWRFRQYILKGTTDFEQCKEDLLQAYNRDCRTEDDADTLIGFCNSQRFHEFVDALKEIQERSSIETFREARGHTLKIVDQIEGVLKK